MPFVRGSEQPPALSWYEGMCDRLADSAHSEPSLATWHRSFPSTAFEARAYAGSELVLARTAMSRNAARASSSCCVSQLPVHPGSSAPIMDRTKSWSHRRP